MRSAPILGLLVLMAVSVHGQTDTISFPWPNPPFAGSHYINGTFSEYRNTLSANHFHSGVDIGEPDNNPIYPSLDGVVHSLSNSAASGSNAFVRVRTPVPGGWKHISYVHIEPAPGLTVGAAVTAGQTIIGTILTGQGHVHFTEREIVASETGTGVEINAIRSGGGLTPFIDTWSPLFDRSTLRFRRSGTVSQLSAGALFGKVDIVVRVNERNSPEAVGGTRTNNGTFGLGYRILTPDTQLTVFEPPDFGLRYRFDRKPSDSYVGFVFDEAVSTTSAHHYYVTNGQGASSVNSTRVVQQNWFDADQLPEASYLLHLFTFDTRQNRDDWYAPIAVTRKDLAPPDRPTLLSVLPDSDAIRVTWAAPADPDLNGFRMYVSSDLGGDFWVGESVLTKTTTTHRLTLPPSFPAASGGLPRVRIRMSAIDTVSPPNEGPFSDTYVGSPAVWPGVTPVAPRIIVDGFDRWGGSGSWGSATHTFANAAAETYAANVPVGTLANEAIGPNVAALLSAGMVHWILGDESTADRTFTSSEQAIVRQLLESGRSMFVSGSEIGWDLARTHSRSEPGDLSFYTNYLKSQFVFDGNTSMTSATGVAGTPFEGYTWLFGQVFPEDFPDDIEPASGAVALLRYNVQRDAQNFRKAGIGYVGTFGASSQTGRLVYVSFPFESMTSKLTRTVMMDKALEFMGVATGVAEPAPGVTELDYALEQNFPNPFNPSTTISFAVPQAGPVSLQVFDIVGRQVATLLDAPQPAGRHTVRWEAGGFASGVYFLRMRAGGYAFTRSMILAR